MPHLQTQIPKGVKHEFDHLLTARRLPVGKQKHQIDVRKWRELAAPETAHRGK